jgi:hypothetical protein
LPPRHRGPTRAEVKVSLKRKTPPPASPQAKSDTHGTLPMQLHVGDRFTDEEGEWEIVTRPWTTHGGKMVHSSVQKPGDPSTKRDTTWGAHERLAIRRA